MKTKLIRTLMLAATIPASYGQAAAPSGIAAESGKTTRSSNAGITSSAVAGAGQNSFQQRLNTILRRGGESAGGSLILTSALPEKQATELAEDLGVLNFIFSRNLERTFADKTTEYRLGVPITLNSRMVETGYIQDYGVLIKVHVPFPVATIEGESHKKSDSASNADSEWEKARRAIYGGGEAANGGGASQQAMVYDENLVAALKKQMLDALKNATNLRHIASSQFITVVVYGGPSLSKSGEPLPDTAAAAAGVGTILTLRITKDQADAAAKNSKSAEDFAREATAYAYFDASSPTRTMSPYGGAYGTYAR
jgi:hypothetical protein